MTFGGSFCVQYTVTTLKQRSFIVNLFTSEYVRLFLVFGGYHVRFVPELVTCIYRVGEALPNILDHLARLQYTITAITHVLGNEAHRAGVNYNPEDKYNSERTRGLRAMASWCHDDAIWHPGEGFSIAARRWTFSVINCQI